jgi:3',5'-cyclic AMP phosphodiesterase CpdA
VKVIAHLSDLHFGTEDPAVAVALLREVDGTAFPVPSLVAVSGDLTQRAVNEQFLACREFLDMLPGPYLVVPGNHDVPMYDVVSRFFHPFRRYRRHIADNLSPSYVDDELQVEGVNTAHPLTIKDGRITPEQVAAICRRFSRAGDRCKVLLAHHPFVLPANHPERERVDGAAEAVPALERAGVELILSGHLHVTYASDAGGFRSDDRAIVAVNAGTCMSKRKRGEANSYNRLTLDHHRLEILQRIWDGRRFIDGKLKEYRREAGRWQRDAAAVPNL